jgi:polyisoprenoid-binding protein YceI
MAIGRRKKIILWVVGAIVVLGGAAVAFGPYIYRDIANKNAPVTPSIDLSTSSGESLSDISGTWRAAGGSYAGYRVNEVLRGVEATVVGRTEQVTGELIIDDVTVSAGSISIDMASVATSISSRDDYFRNNTMHTSQYPNATFELTTPVQVSTPLVVGEKESFEVKGKLTIHGVTRDITTSLETGFDGTYVQVAGSIPVVFSDYGVKAPDLGFVTVEPNGSIELLIKFQQS